MKVILAESQKSLRPIGGGAKRVHGTVSPGKRGKRTGELFYAAINSRRKKFRPNKSAADF